MTGQELRVRLERNIKADLGAGGFASIQFDERLLIELWCIDFNIDRMG